MPTAVSAAPLEASGDVDRALPSLRTHWPDLALALGTAVYGAENSLGLFTYGHGMAPTYRGPAALLLVMFTAAAAGLFRVRPGVALGLMWLSPLLQLAASLPVMQVQLAALFVAYGAARYGSGAVLWASGVSVPLGMATGLLVVHRYWIQRPSFLPDVISVTEAARLAGLPLTVVCVQATLAMPWLVGALRRARDTARRDQARAEARRARAEAQRARAETERTQAQEIAALRERQAQLARDVHDVVGHSLAVILVQAESAQFLDNTDEAVQRTMANIAASARQSLRDVRDVLVSTSDEPGVGTRAPGSLEGLLEGVRAAGYTLESSVLGEPRPLPPELDTVAFRVLQEMLTNALKHGRHGETVFVQRDWQHELRLEVRNMVADGVRWPYSGAVPGGGMGIDGMRRRLTAVGGRFAAGWDDDGHGGWVFTATAWMPVRAGTGT